MKPKHVRIRRGPCGSVWWKITLTCGCQVRRLHLRNTGRPGEATLFPRRLICQRHESEDRRG